MDYGLPKSVNIDGEDFEIRYDYRIILDIFEVMNNPELSDQERGLDVLQLFYMDFDALTDYDAAMKKCMEFINGGRDEPPGKTVSKLISWEQDFPYVVAPVNRVLGYEIREVGYDPETNTGGVHWWTWLSAYQEIGDCLFSQIVGIRSKRAKGKKLDKSEQEFYRKNKDIVDIKRHYTEADDNLIEYWAGKK